ncbi:MAG: hypothetical protein ACE5FB_04530, partial [Candidatus Binatia bacterium]
SSVRTSTPPQSQMRALIERSTSTEKPPRLSFKDANCQSMGIGKSMRRVLVRKGLLTNEEVLEEVKAVRRKLEGKRGR